MNPVRSEAECGARLKIYLRDHHAAARAGRQLAARCASENEGNELGEYIKQTLLPDIDTDRSVLDEVLLGLDIAPSELKDYGARMVEFLGRLKPNGQLTGYSPLSRVLELEGLIAGVNAKRRLWATIELLRDLPGFTGLPDVAQRIDVAAEQLDALERHHARAVEDAFGAAEPAPGD